MWDYDKLFADGNIIGVKNCYRNEIFPNSIDGTTSTAWLNAYKNNNLCCKDQHVDVDDVVKHGYTTDFDIQYIIRLDEHGNVAEKLFDRDRDMEKSIPKLETGMFVRVYTQRTKTYALAVVYEDRIIYQTGEWDDICDVLSEDDLNTIVEVYPSNVLCFNGCSKGNAIWSRSEY